MSNKLLTCLVDNFQLPEGRERCKGAYVILDLILTNRKELRDEMKVAGSLRELDQVILEV